MFTIDLLKGRKLPAKTKPQAVALFAMTFAIPFVVATGVFGYYVNNRIVTTVQNHNIRGYEKKIEKLADSMKLNKEYEEQKSTIQASLAEVAGALNQHVQWSGMLVTLVEQLPSSVVLTKLEVRMHSVKKKVPMAGDPSKKVDAAVTTRTLKLTVSGLPDSNCDQDIKAFRDKLKDSKLVGPLLEDIVIVSQGFGTLDGEEVVSYEIECILKPQEE